MRRSLLVLATLLAAFLVSPDAPGQDAPDAPKDPNQKNLDELRYQQFAAELANRDSVKRAGAIQSLRGLGLAKACLPLLELARDEKYAYIVSFAAETAVQLDPENAEKLVLDMARQHKGSSPQTDRNLVLMLRECPGQGAAEIMLENFDGSTSKEVRLEVIRSVGITKPTKGVAYLKQALGSRDLDERNVAAVAAGRLASTELIPQLFAGLEVTDSFHCMFAAQALTRIADPSIFLQTSKSLGSASGLSGEAKAKVLEGSATKDDVEALISILKTHRSREYREAAAVALGRVGERKKEVQEILFARPLGRFRRLPPLLGAALLLGPLFRLLSGLALGLGLAASILFHLALSLGLALGFLRRFTLCLGLAAGRFLRLAVRLRLALGLLRGLALRFSLAAGLLGSLTLRLRQIPALAQHLAQIVVRLGQIRLPPQRLAVSRHRLLGTTLLAMNPRQVVVRDRILRRKLKHAPEALRRGIERLGLRLRHPPQVPHIRILRIRRAQPLAQSPRLLQTTGLDQCFELPLGRA